MLQCKDCEFCETTPQGQRTFKCDPFTNIKEPECIQKWQLIRLDMLVAGHRNLISWYEKMGPMQKKIFKYVQKELEGIDEAESWKTDDPEDAPPPNPENDDDGYF